MRKLLFGAAVSLDNFIARPDGGVDWLLWSEDVARITTTYWNTVDTVLAGRKTYEVALQSGTASYPGKMTYVYSKTLPQQERDDVEVVSEDAVEHVRRLKESDGEGICVMGGGVLGASLLAAGLVDEVGVNVHPVLLGSGIPMFHPMERQIALELIETEPIAHGCVYSLYRVVAS